MAVEIKRETPPVPKVLPINRIIVDAGKVWNRLIIEPRVGSQDHVARAWVNDTHANEEHMAGACSAPLSLSDLEALRDGLSELISQIKYA